MLLWIYNFIRSLVVNTRMWCISIVVNVQSEFLLPQSVQSNPGQSNHVVNVKRWSNNQVLLYSGISVAIT